MIAKKENDMGATNEPINKRKDSIATLSEEVSALEKDVNEFYLRLRYLEQAVLESGDYAKIFKRANELYERGK